MMKPDKSWFLLLTGAATLVFLMQLLLLDIAEVKGRSMEPGYRNGQIIWIHRTAYGLLLPMVNRYWGNVKTPVWDDVLVFDLGNGRGLVVKRVLGIPGDHLILEEDRFWISTPEPAYRNHWGLGPGTLQGPFDLPGQSPLRTVPPLVPPGHILVLGDNPERSHDSRHFGYLPLEQVRGKVLRFHHEKP